MSSTRVADRKGTFLDFYETPEKTTRGLLETGFLDGATTVLEPSAGRGAIVRLVNHLKVTAVEIQPEFADDLKSISEEVIIGDFLSCQPGSFSRIIANPPFSQAEAFIRHAFTCLEDDGKMAFLLRLPFIASVKRYHLMAEMKPASIYVLSQRPKFGGTNIDSCDYAWIVWTKTRPEITVLDWIGRS